MAEPSTTGDRQPVKRSFRETYWYELGALADGFLKVLFVVGVVYLPAVVVVHTLREGVEFVSGTEPTSSYCPDAEPGRCTLLDEDLTWSLAPGAAMETTLKPSRPAIARGAQGWMSVHDGCAGAEVAWQIFADDTQVVSGVIRPGPPRELESARRVAPPVERIRITAHRTDTVNCTATFEWAEAKADVPWPVWPWHLWPL
ncbi:hypothetical protein ABGB07_23375 [Micromonosporaceae bacterium B7E4]